MRVTLPDETIATVARAWRSATGAAEQRDEPEVKFAHRADVDTVVGSVRFRSTIRYALSDQLCPSASSYFYSPTLCLLVDTGTAC